jgi:predicted NBD/HSP70 family sugar kinase
VSFGLIIGGRVYRGSQGYAGELGHRPINDDGSRCLRCGRNGCLESTISASNIAADLGASEEDLPAAADFIFKKIGDEANSDEAPVYQRIAQATQRLAETVALLVDALDPEAVILAGSIGEQIHYNTGLLGTFRSTLESSQMGFASNIGILEPTLGAESAVRGAILRVLSERLVPWARHRLEAVASSATVAGRPKKEGRRR